MLYTSSILEPLRELASRELQLPILISGNEAITLRELLQQSLDLAYQLQRHGLQANDMVIVAVAPGTDFVRVMYATSILRAQVALIDPEMGRDLYAAKLKQLKPKWAFVDTRLLLLQEHPLVRLAYFKLAQKPVYFPWVPGLQIIGTGPRLPLLQPFTHLRKLKQSAGEQAALAPDPGDHDFLVTYTSGTLQEPKGVLHGFASLSQSIGLLAGVVENHPDDILATYLPHFVMLGVTTSLPVVIYDPKMSVPKKLAFFREKQISILFGPPSDFLPLIRYCEENDCRLPDTFRHLLLGSAPVHKSFLRRLVAVSPPGLRLTITYGMTEHLLVSTADGHAKLNYSGEGDLVGRPVPGVEIKIAEDGELFIRSAQLYTRYYHQARREDFHATGDLARLDAEGNLMLMGRKKEMIIRSNTNIYPALYEDTIKKIPGVEEAALVGIYNPEKEDEDVFLVVETSRPLTAKYILDKISYGEYQIEKNALPDEVILMTVPRKGRQHKIDRRKIAETIRERQL